MFIFHIDLSLKVAMVTENGRQYRLKKRKCHFGPQFGGFFCCCTARFVSDLVGNPEDRFSHNEAQLYEQTSFKIYTDYKYLPAESLMFVCLS